MAIAFVKTSITGDGTNPLAGSVVISAATGNIVGGGNIGVLRFEMGGGTTPGVTNVAGGTTGFWNQMIVFHNGACWVEIWATDLGSGTLGNSVTVDYSGTPDTVIGEVSAFSGVVAYGNTWTASGSTANPAIVTATQDANNVNVACIGTLRGTDPTALVGTLRNHWGQSPTAGTVQCDLGAVENTRAAAGSLTLSETQAAAVWAAVALELRSTTAVASVLPYDLAHTRQHQALLAQ